MAHQVYGYAGAGLYSARLGGASASDAYLGDPSLMTSSRYLTSDPLSAAAADSARAYDPLRFSAAATRISGATVTPPFSQPTWLSADSLPASSVEPGVPGIKRPAEALYHQTLMGTHNAIMQNEALYSSNAFAKRPRYESASNLPIYPQRPGEKDCAYYMMTRTCKFGDSCKFDHPLWVPEGGIPDWKEVPFVPNLYNLPERPGEPDCPYFLKTWRCKFGIKCKFNHPKDNIQKSSGDGVEGVFLPERPSEPICSYYLKMGKCKFGVTCKFHHPKDIQIPSGGQDPGSEQTVPAVNGEIATGDANSAKYVIPFTPALLHNSKGLPIRPGEPDCPFYLKTGSCKYGATCRYNHPDRYAINLPVAGTLGHPIVPSPAANLSLSVINPSVSIIPNIDPRLAPTALSMGPTVYPQRPGQMECDFYMKTGECKFGERCKFHHPIDRSALTPSMMKQQNVKLTLAGLPRREGAIHCPFYMKTGTCKYGATCRFDHPPPGEVIAMTSVSVEGEVKDAEYTNTADTQAVIDAAAAAPEQ